MENREKFVCERLKDSIEEYLNLNKNTEFKLVIPENLKKFIKLQIPNWCKQAYKAKHYLKLNNDYVIGKRQLSEKERDELKEEGFIPREFNRICPVDFGNTGVVSESMVWSDGLTQFLEVKHGLKITPEDLTTTFLSHYIYMRKYITDQYGNNIYGVTGTLGKESSHNLLKELFEVDVYIIPPFRPSRLNTLEGKTNFKNKDQWKNCVIENILHNTIKLNRAVLVISLTIEESNELYDELAKKPESKINNLSLFKYQRNDSEEKGNQLKQRYNEREVIFATNLAGRGTDIGLTEVVGKSGGMHVIVTFIPSNSRIEEQAFGRTARSGARGSAIIIANENKDIKELLYNRDIKEDERIDKIRSKEIKSIKIRSQLFDKFTSFFQKLKQIYSPNILKLFGFENPMGESMLKDLEENWGIWLMENCKENEEEINENIILEKYKNYENDLKKKYLKDLEQIEFQNPMNYINGELFKKGYNKSKDLCFYGNYLDALEKLNGESDYDIKNEAISKIPETINFIENNMIPQLGGTEIIISHVKNYFAFFNKNEFPIDIESKMNSFQKLRNTL